MSYKEGMLAMQTIGGGDRSEADPTWEQELLASSIFIEWTHAPIMASLIAKAKAAKQAKN